MGLWHTRVLGTDIRIAIASGFLVGTLVFIVICVKEKIYTFNEGLLNPALLLFISFIIGVVMSMAIGTSVGTPRIVELLEKEGIKVSILDLSELNKGIGSVYCMPVFLKRDK